MSDAVEMGEMEADKSSFGDDNAKRIAEVRASPEFEARAWGGLAADIAVFFPDAIDDGDENTVGNGVGALDGAPGIVLRFAELGFLCWVPADGGWVEQHVCALQGGEARTLGIPLIPADKRADASGLGIEGAVPKVAGSEVILFVIERVVRDVHLPIFAEECAVGVEDGGGVVVDAGGALFEE